MKNALIDFFQKKDNDKNKNKKSRPGYLTEHKVKLSEAKFSVDQRGREIQNLYKRYINAYAMDDKDNILIKQQFISFADEFIGAYEIIIEHQREEPLYCEDEREPKSIEDTWGHPTHFVIHVAKLLLEYLPTISRSNDTNSSEILDFSLRWVFDDNCVDLSLMRQHFLRILYTLSIICFWPHNRNLLFEYVGKTFIRVVILVIRILISKVEEVIVDIIQIGKQEVSTIERHANSTANFKDDANFLLHALMASVHILARGSPGLVRCLSVYNSFYFPNQPWSAQQRMSFGYSEMSSSLNYETRPSQSLPLGSLNNIFPTPMDEYYLPEELFIQYEGNFDNLDEDAPDGWSSTLIRCGSLRALISLISKLTYLNKALASTSLYSLSLTNCDNLLLRPSHLTWKSSIALQCEAIVAILSFLTSQPLSTSMRLHISDGFSIMNSLLSMQDCPAIELISRNDFNLGMHRSFLCLRLTEIIIDRCNKDINYPESILTDTLQSFDNIQHYLSWVHGYLINSKCYAIEGDLSSFRNVHVKISNTPTALCSAPGHDLWPWEEFDFSGTDEVYDAVKTLVEVDLCDWGGVMLGYAGTESLLMKYIRSIKHSGIYSLRGAFIDVFEGTKGSRNLSLPWFAYGYACEVWDNVFSVLHALCLACAPNKAENSQELKNKFLTSILTEIFQSLSYCILAPTISLKESNDEILSFESTSPVAQSYLPMLQMQIILFIGICVDLNPGAVIHVSRLCKLWMLLSTSTSFLLGGQQEISDLFRLGKRIVETNGQFSSTTWCLHCNFIKGYEYPTMTNRSRSSFVVRGEKEYLHEEDDLNIPLESLSDSDIRSNRPRRDTVESFPRDNEGEYGENSYDADESSPLQYTLDTIPEVVVDADRPRPESLLNDLDMENQCLSVTIDHIHEISTSTYLSAFAWLSLGDFIMQLMSLVVDSESNLKSSKLPGPSVEVQILLQAITKETPDHVITQTMSWLQNTISMFDPSEDAEKYRQVLFKCVSLCKYQLLTCSDPTKSVPVIDSVVPFWIGEEIVEISYLRPLLWPARNACLNVVKNIMLSMPGDSWIKAFLPKIQPPLQGGENLSKTMITPKHATLLLLILDPKCRQVALRLLVEIMHVCTCITFSLPQSQKDVTNGFVSKSIHHKADTDTSKTIYLALFHDIVKYLIVSHIKYALLQPSWCDGAGIVSSVCQWMKFFLCNISRRLYLSYYQQMLMKYGPSTHYHQLLNWTKPRPNIFRETLLSLDECIRNFPESTKSFGARRRDIQVLVMRHFLSLLTAFMMENIAAKSKFTNLMTLRKFSKNKSKVTLLVGSETNNPLLHPANPCNIHDVAAMIVSLEGSPSIETILVLFDLLLDGPKQSNRSYIIQAQIASTVGMFFQETTKVCFSNTVIISILLLLIPSCSEEIQTFIFSSLKNLLVGRLSLVNLSKCSDMPFPVLDSLIDLFPVMPRRTLHLCTKLMHIVGKHNVTVAQLKRIFRLMHVKQDYRPPHTSLLLECLRLMINNTKMPRHFFLFEGGTDSGIKIPTISRWPAPGGYSFCFWFSIQHDGTSTLSSSTDGSIGSCRIINSKSEACVEYRPTLFSFRQNSGIGVEVFLRPHPTVINGYSIHFHTHKDLQDANECSSVDIFSYYDGERERPLYGGEWNFLCFSHLPGKFRSRSEIQVLLNSALSRHQLSFPRYFGEIEEPIIGDLTPKFASPKILSAFRGQMGSFYFFAESLNEQQMRKIFALGMDVSHEIETTYVSKRLLQSQSSDPTTSNAESISTSVMLAYYPGVGDGSRVLDMSPEKNANRWGKESVLKPSRASFSGTADHERLSAPFRTPRVGGKMHSSLMVGCHRCTFNDMRDALDCLGGKRALIPLFAQFDLPIFNPEDNSADFSIDTKMCEEIVELFFALSRENDENSPQFELMAYFLERISPKYLSTRLLQIFLDNLYKFPSTAWSGGVVKNILFHLKLWSKASFDTQRRLLVYLVQLCQEDPYLMGNFISIRELFDMLTLFYSESGAGPFQPGDSEILENLSDFSIDFEDFSDQSRLSASNINLGLQSPLPNPRTFQREFSADGKDILTELQCEELRQLLFQIIFALMTRTSPESGALGDSSRCITPDDLQCIMYYLSNVSASTAKLQALSLLLSLLNTSSISLQKQLVNGLESGVKIYPVLILHTSPVLQIRLYAFLTFCNILRLIIIHGHLPLPSTGSRRDVPTPAHKSMKKGTPEHTTDTISLDDIAEISTEGSDSEDSDAGDEFLEAPIRKGNSHSPLSSSPKNSFSFMSPKNFSGKGFFRDLGRTHQTMDTFENIGVPISKLRYVLSWIEANILTPSENAEESVSDYDQHCRAVVNIMSLTLVGQSIAHLRETIDELFPTHGLIYPRCETSDDSANDNLSESIFCLPSFLPAIIRFISRNFVSYSLRFSTLVAIKTKLQTFQNSDLFLQVPDWQISLFELLSMEQHRLDHLRLSKTVGDSIQIKDINRSSGIIDTATRMLCDLIIHCVEYGCPSPDSVVDRPNFENSRSPPKPTPLSMIQEISRGKRIFAPIVLKETIGYLKCFTKGSEKDVSNVAVSFLQQIVNALTSRNESWKTSEVKEEYQQYIRGRAFHVCCWLSCSFILEFITSPTLEHAIDISPKKQVKGIRRGSASQPPILTRSQSSPDDIPLQTHKNQRPTTLDLNYIYETYDPSLSRVRSWSSPRSDVQHLHLEPSPQYSAIHFFDIGVDQNSSRLLWDLLESIINLLDTLGTFQGSTQARIRIALSLGIKSSADVLDVVNEAIDESLPSTSVPLGVSDTDLEKKLFSIPIRKISAMICWRIIRISCHIYCCVSRETLPPLQQTLQLESVRKMEQIFITLESKDWGFPRFEILLTVIRIVTVLRQTSHRAVDLWVQDSFRLLIILLEKVRNDVVARLYQVGFSFVDSSFDQNSSQASLSGFINELNETTDEIDVRKLSSLSSDSQNDLRKSTSELVLLNINRSLQVPPDTPITWSIWDAAMAHVIAEGIRMEDEALSGQLTELGLDKGRVVAACQLETFRTEEELQFGILSKRYQLVAKRASDHEIDALKKYASSIEMAKKRNMSRWNLILEDLANERGPWGVGAEEEVEVYWMIDICEDSLRRRLKFKRNPYGSRHEIATQIAFGRVNPDDSEGSTSECVTEGAAYSVVTTTTTTQSLWRDLLKYQSRPNQRGDDSSNVENGEDLSDEALIENADLNRNISTVLESDTVPTPVIETSEKILFSASCEIITPATNSLCRPAYGTIEVTSSKITFTKKGPAPQRKAVVVNFHTSQIENDQFLWAIRTFPSMQWSVDEIRNILPRTFYLRQIAVELFLSSRRCVFINLLHQHAAMQFIIAIRFLVKAPNIEPYYGLKPQNIVQKMIAPGTTSPITLAWQNREISNFQYLMHLNTIAGRSFNDLGQYPVFPWVIADYVSDELRLRDPETFRDLKWPVGAQRLEQREEISARYEDLDTMYQLSQEANNDVPALPPFHFGSHYSTAGFVMWYLMRAEPFTSLHVQLQDGKFDKADRLFDSIAAAWNGCIHNPSDVKELVPEFFYCPEIFENINKLDLGRKMNGDRKALGDIVLPPWASDAFEFIRLHRKALESEYVSQNLHHWIDLIFGYKQRPPFMRIGGNKATVDSCNVFFHLTYAGAVDLESLLEKDKVLYGQYVNQIAEFGQTPAQLFLTPHPQRLSLDEADIAWPIASVVLGADTIMKGGCVPDKPKKVMCFKAYKMSVRPIVFIAESVDRLVTVDSSRVIGNHLWQSLQPDVTPPYRIKVDNIALEVSQGLGSGSSIFTLMNSSNMSSKDKRINVPFYNQMIPSTSPVTDLLDDDFHKSEPLSKKEFLKFEREFRREGRKSISSTFSQATQNVEFSSPLSTSNTMTPTSMRSSVKDSAKKLQTSPSPLKARPPNIIQKRRTRIATIDENVSSQLFAIHPTQKILFSCGHWDQTFKVTAFETGRLLQSINAHRDVVTCIFLAVEVGKTWLVTGSRDCTLMIWEVFPSRDLPLGEGTPLRTLYGHDDCVASVSVNIELDVVASGSNDGTVILHTLREGSYLRTILVGTSPRNLSDGSIHFDSHSMGTSSTRFRSRIHWVCITNEGYLVIYLDEERLLYSYTINGRLLASKDVQERLYAFIPSEDGQVLVTGGDNCLVVFRWVHSLELANDGPRKGLEAVLDGVQEELEDPNHGPICSTIRSLYFTKQERHLFVGTDSGEVRIFAQDSEYLRQRLERKLAEIGIL